MKACSKCKIPKSLDKFNKDNSKKDGIYPSCKQCNCADTRNNVVVSQNEKLCTVCKELLHKSKFAFSRTNNSGLQSKCRMCAKSATLFFLYGVSLQEYATMSALQNHKCAICDTKEKTKHLAVDHCHATGRVRGLLCTNCNQGLGHMKDSIILLQKLINYLEKYHA